MPITPPMIPVIFGMLLTVDAKDSKQKKVLQTLLRIKIKLADTTNPL